MGDCNCSGQAVRLRADLSQLLRDAKGEANDADGVVKALPRIPTYRNT
jgi:hypothetical protein